MKYYLLVYDKKTGRLLEPPREFGEADALVAQRERFQREIAERTRPDVEVNLLGAESLDQLRRTHSRYFKSLDELVTTS